jgi:hypothetical protein
VIALALLLLQTADAPVLAFPEAGLDDTAAYQGYQTRLYRDSKGNTVQIYLDAVSGRVVHLWADAADESLGFTARGAAGRPLRLAWSGDSATTTDSAGARALEYRLSAPTPGVTLGWFLLGSMRVERDFQYNKAHLRPFTAPAFVVAEESLLVANVGRLAPAERSAQLALLGAERISELAARLRPTVAGACTADRCAVRVSRPSLDGRNRLALELSSDPRETTMRIVGRTVVLRGTGQPARFTVRIATDGAALTPLPRDSIFGRPFLDFLADAATHRDSTRGRRLEREVRSVELLSSAEKLMAGLPNFATYFGRDMLMTALMMRPVWRPAMSEYVIASALRKLGPGGDVSHEEALGGQAIRESAAEYNALMARYFAPSKRPAAATVCDTAAAVRACALRGARVLLRDLQRTRENYHMLDDEFQLPILEARYLADTTVPAGRKRAFLTAAEGDGATRVALMLRELALVAEWTGPYARDPRPEHLVSFVKRDATHWRSSSWRDSDAGYANGRFAMDINAIWAPRALDAMARILAILPTLGYGRTALDSLLPDSAATLRAYLADSAGIRRAVDVWRGARRHFAVTLAPAEIERQVSARLASLPPAERGYWRAVIKQSGEVHDSLTYLALALDSAARPIPVANSDPATELFLDATSPAVPALDQLAVFMRPYPVGLRVDGLGPVAANDAYASPVVWKKFANDAYHSPRVVWGREVNLLLLGLATIERRATGPADTTQSLDLGRVGDALTRTMQDVHASGLAHNELWSYRVAGGRLIPTRYGSGSDVQLWSTTDLAVQFMLSRLPTRRAP